MEAKRNTVTLTVNPQKLLDQYPNLSNNLREMAAYCRRCSLDMRVEFLPVQFPTRTENIPLSAMPCHREEAHNA